MKGRRTCLNRADAFGDLGEIASAISDSEDRLRQHSIIIGNNSSILIAENVIVDKFWRGNRLGPALMFFAADVLRADGIFLTPVALRTRLCVAFLKLFEKIYAPLTAGLPAPFRGDRLLA